MNRRPSRITMFRGDEVRHSEQVNGPDMGNN